MFEQLDALVKLAHIDVSARDLESELAEAPRRLEENQANLKQLQGLLAAEQKQVEEAQKLLSAQEEEMKEQTQALARSKSKSAKARTMREIEAVERELETIRRTIRDREEERARLKAAIEQRSAMLTQHEKELEELATFVSNEEQAIRAGIERLEAERNRVSAGRNEVVAKIPAVLLKRYELIRSRRGGSAVAKLNGDTCGGCFMVLPPQQSNSIRRGETLEQCPRCQRFLYAVEEAEKPQ